ncbi:hypothetical protein QTP88_007495 [Uroleucon formosanum]
MYFLMRETTSNKLKNVLMKNNGFKVLKNISAILKIQKVEMLKFCQNQIAHNLNAAYSTTNNTKVLYLQVMLNCHVFLMD